MGLWGIFAQDELWNDFVILQLEIMKIIAIISVNFCTRKYRSFNSQILLPAECNVSSRLLVQASYRC